MSFPERLATYRRLWSENGTWKLLRAANAPLILAFVSETFADGAEVPVPSARALLDKHLNDWREAGNATDTDASGYIRTWTDAGFLREADQMLSMTDTCQTALNFTRSMDTRDLGATASHLRIVQRAVRDLAVQLSGDVTQQIETLITERQEIDRRVELLSRGYVEDLSDDQQRERIREVLMLARQLSGDFRLLDDEIRLAHQRIMQEMNQGLDRRGHVVRALLLEEDILSKSIPGQAFQGFYELLSDAARSTEFREQLRSLSTHEAARYLSSEERRYLGHLMRELSSQSQNVFNKRRRTEQRLRAYLESGAHREDKAIAHLLSELFRLGAQLKGLPDFDPRSPTTVVVGTGRAKITAADALDLHYHDDTEASQPIENHGALQSAPAHLFENLRAIRVRDVAARMLTQLREEGGLTIAGIAHEEPIDDGLEGLVAMMRVAESVGGVHIGGNETVEFTERDGSRGRARIPRIVLRAEDFPEDLGELDL